MVMTFSIAFVSTVTTGPPLFFLLGCPLEQSKVLVPIRLKVGPQLRDALGARPIQAPRAVPSLAHQARLLQHPQVLRDRWSSHVEVAGDLARGELGGPDQAQDLAPARLGDSAYRGFHRHM